MTNLIKIMTGFLLLALPLSAQASTLYSKVTVSAPSGEGKVYVSKENTTPADSDYKDGSAELTQNSTHNQNVKQAYHTYYLYAKPNEEKQFSHWEKGGISVSTSNPYEAKLLVSGTSASEPTSFEYVAKFIDAALVKAASTHPMGTTVTITPVSNKTGDEITVTASINRIADGYQCLNMMIEFEGWRDQNGVFVSTDPTYTFTATESTTLTAVFKTKDSIKTAGYYRLRNFVNRVLSVEGGFKYTVTGSNDYLTGLLRYAYPYGNIDSNFHNTKYESDDYPGVEVESLPSTVIYIKGTNLNPEASTGEDVLSDVVAYGQGTDTKSMTGKTFSIQPAAGSAPGYHILYGGLTAGMKMGLFQVTGDINGDGINSQNSIVPYIGKSTSSDTWSWWAIQPIDEEHFDEFWFGAKADEEMAFDNGYWTSMYTAFPYECRDGVEAYYAKETTEQNGVHYVQLVKIEDGIVPPATPVILKCQGLSSRENRLMPLDPDGEYQSIEGNLFKGEYQLYTDKDLNGRKDFDPAAMRVFGVNANGELGFYKMSANDDGSQRELLPNKIYLDMSLLSESAASAPIRASFGDKSGIETVIDSKDDNQPSDGKMYDLNGRSVSDPTPGSIFIMDGKKYIAH